MTSNVSDRDYPQMAATRGRIEPALTQQAAHRRTQPAGGRRHAGLALHNNRTRARGRRGHGGPRPVAAKRLPAEGFPLSFQLGQADAVMGGTLPDHVNIEARWDADGVA